MLTMFSLFAGLSWGQETNALPVSVYLRGDIPGKDAVLKDERPARLRARCEADPDVIAVRLDTLAAFHQSLAMAKIRLYDVQSFSVLFGGSLLADATDTSQLSGHLDETHATFQREVDYLSVVITQLREDRQTDTKRCALDMHIAISAYNGAVLRSHASLETLDPDLKTLEKALEDVNLSFAPTFSLPTQP